jgi:hypothetical protein
MDPILQIAIGVSAAVIWCAAVSVFIKMIRWE